MSQHGPYGPKEGPAGLGCTFLSPGTPILGFWLHLHGLGALTVAKPMKVQSETQKGVPGLRNVQPFPLSYQPILIQIIYCGLQWSPWRCSRKIKIGSWDSEMGLTAPRNALRALAAHFWALAPPFGFLTAPSWAWRPNGRQAHEGAVRNP